MRRGPQTQLVREALRLVATVQLVEPGAAAREGLTPVGEEPTRVPFWALTAFPATKPLSQEQVRICFCVLSRKLRLEHLAVRVHETLVWMGQRVVESL